MSKLLTPSGFLERRRLALPFLVLGPGRLGSFRFAKADFVGGGVAGALKGAPHVPTGDGAVGPPAFAEGEEFFGAGFVFFSVGDGPAFLHAQVVDGKNVWAAKAKDQKHFDGPRTDTADGDEAFDEFFVRHFFGIFHGWNNAFDRFLRDIFHGEDFCAGESGFAQGPCAELEHFLRSGNAAGGAKRFYAAEDRGSRFAGNGLVSDGFEERFVGRLVRFHLGLEGSGVENEFSQDFVAGAEVFCGRVQVKGKHGRLVDQVRAVILAEKTQG